MFRIRHNRVVNTVYSGYYNRGGAVHCGLGLAKGWSAEKLEVLVTRYVSKLLKAKLTTLATNVNDVLEVAKRQRRRYLGSRS